MVCQKCPTTLLWYEGASLNSVLILPASPPLFFFLLVLIAFFNVLHGCENLANVEVT